MASPKSSRLVLRLRPQGLLAVKGYRTLNFSQQRRKTQVPHTQDRQDTFSFFKSQENPTDRENTEQVPPQLRLSLKPVSSTPRSIAQSARPSLPAPEAKGCLEDFLLGKQLGQGAYATVRAATHLATGRIVAIKTYEKQKLLDPQRKKSVQREIRILLKLDHPNIIKLIDTMETQKQLHLMLELVPGISLSTYLKQRSDRRLEECEAKRVFRQLLAGIEYCHSHNVTHRDLKLENVLLDDHNNVKIIDFGFATCFARDKKVKMYCGTPSYMAPEIFGKKEYCGPPADVWALGVMLYAMLCGTLPFKGQNDHELRLRIQRGQYQIPPHVPPGAKAVLQAIFTLDPEKRPSLQQLSSDSWVALQLVDRRQLSLGACKPSTESLKPLLPRLPGRTKAGEESTLILSSRLSDCVPECVQFADRKLIKMFILNGDAESAGGKNKKLYKYVAFTAAAVIVLRVLPRFLKSSS